MSGPFIFSRRRFLQQTGAFSALSLAASMPKIGLSSAAAAAPGYQALVCVFMFGGNDANNMVMPFTDYAEYNLSRAPATGLNIPNSGAGQMLQISPTNTGVKTYGLHPQMGALKLLFDSGALAVVANCGPLVDPITRAQYLQSGHGGQKVPLNLFSHNDQQQQFMTSVSQATLGPSTGWAGRLADKVVGMNAANATPMSMSFSGTQTFGNGVSVRTLALPTGGTFGFSGDGGSAQQIARINARALMMQALDANPLVAAAQNTMGTAMSSSALMSGIISGAGTPANMAPFVGITGSLATQLKAVAKVIENRVIANALGHQREIFFVSTGGFDTHSGQMTAHNNLYGGTPLGTGGLSNALYAFYQSTVLMGVASNVTTFTMSDFSRTMKPNGSGTEHAWGTHNFVLGGAVLGKKFYGQPDSTGFVYPNVVVSGPNDSGGQGRWIPTTSIEQYGATLAKWFGAADVDVDQIFPQLPLQQAKIPTWSRNLGFLG